MYYTVYKITNIINGKYYIGIHKTTNLEDGYMGSGIVLNYAIEKYGIDNFIKEILYVFDNEKQMRLTERILVVPDNEINYNIMKGGRGGFEYVNKVIDITFRKEIGHKGGSISGPKTVRNKTGLFGLSKEKQIENARKGGQSHKGKSKSLDWRNEMKKLIWINDGTKSKKHHKDCDLPEGWNKGRLMTWQ